MSTDAQRETKKTHTLTHPFLSLTQTNITHLEADVGVDGGGHGQEEEEEEGQDDLPHEGLGGTEAGEEAGVVAGYWCGKRDD